MNSEFHSLPDAVAAEIKQILSQIAPQSQPNEDLSIGERIVQAPQQVEPTINRALLHIAQTSPELLASIILSQLGVTAIEVIESEEHREDRLVRQSNGSYHYTEVTPFVTRRIISRQVRLVTGKRPTIGRLA